MMIAQSMSPPAGPARGSRDARHDPGSVLSCRGLRASVHGSVVLDDVWFEVRSGEAFGVIGQQGTGKTTLARAVCGLLPADSGVLLIGGRVVEAPERGKEFGHARHDGGVLPTATVIDNLRFWARVRGVDLPAGIVSEVGLEEHADLEVERCPPHVGRLLGLAVPLLLGPRLLVVDEITGGLDREGADQVVSAVGRVREHGTSVLYTGRRADDVRSVCDRVRVLEGGRLVRDHGNDVGLPQPRRSGHAEKLLVTPAQ